MRMDEAEHGGNRGVGWVAIAAGAAMGLGAYYFLRSAGTRREHAGFHGAPDPYLTESITINAPLERVYDAWRNLESIGFMHGTTITGSRQHEMYEWRTDSGAVGRVEFRHAPGGRGTEVHVHLERGAVRTGGKVTRMFGLATDQQIKEDLRRFKQLIETGELMLSDGPGLRRPAQPAPGAEAAAAYAGVPR
jgi:uncharacterized membrane protein